MKTKHLTFVLAFAAATLSAQTDVPPPVVIPPPPPPPAEQPTTFSPTYGYYGFNNPGPSPTLAGVVTVPYAFNWHASGISGELGGLWNGGLFIGGEASYYNGETVRYNVYNGSAYLGHFDSALQLTTLDLAARYFIPIWSVNAQARLVFYFGASGGVGFVDYSNSGHFFGFHDYSNGNWTGEVVGGFQLDVAPHAALRLGYRYVVVSDAWQFDHQANLESSVLEAGVACRF